MKLYSMKHCLGIEPLVTISSPEGESDKTFPAQGPQACLDAYCL